MTYINSQPLPLAIRRKQNMLSFLINRGVRKKPGERREEDLCEDQEKKEGRQVRANMNI
jgi:hypothetical protein